MQEILSWRVLIMVVLSLGFCHGGFCHRFPGRLFLTHYMAILVLNLIGNRTRL